MKGNWVVALLVCTIAVSPFAGIIFQDGFESGDKSHTENGARWTSANGFAGCAPVVSSDRSNGGSYSLKYIYKACPVGEDGHSEQRFNLGNQYPEVWIQFDIYIPANYFHRNDIPGNNKVMQIWAADPDNPGKGGYRSEMGLECWPSGNGNSRLTYNMRADLVNYGHKDAGMWVDRSTDLGKWHTWLIHLKVASAANNDGVLQIWKNGSKMFDKRDLTNYGAEGYHYYDDMYFLGWSNSGFAEDTYPFLDNLQISTDYKIEDLVITTSTLPEGTVGQPYGFSIVKQGGTGPFMWSMAGGMQPGLMLDTLTGHISGVPQMSGLRQFTIKVTDAKGNWGEVTYRLTVKEASALRSERRGVCVRQDATPVGGFDIRGRAMKVGTDRAFGMNMVGNRWRYSAKR